MVHVDLTLTVVGVLAFALGGLAKGLTGIGLPMIAVPILSLLLGVPNAIALMIVPIVASNLLQTLRGGQLADVLRRFWPLIVCLVVSLYFATYLLGRLRGDTLLVITGATLLGSTAVMWRMPKLELSPERERSVGAAIGLFSGLLGGLTGLAGAPVVLYFIGLGLRKERFQASISMVYFLSTIPLIVGLVRAGFLGWQELTWSMVALVPTFGGMAIGLRLLRFVSADRFQHLVLAMVAAMGAAMVYRGMS